MNKKQIFPFFLLYVITIISSIIAVILYIKYYPIESNVITENINKTVVTEKGIEEAISNVYDAVVTVNSYFGDTKVGTGSGFIYKNDDKGYILTNNHVIESANNYTVILSTGETVEAKLLGSVSYSDLAVLSIDKDTDIIYVLGSKISNNTLTLKKLAEESHPNAKVIMIENASYINKEDLKGIKKVAITSGASTSKETVL